LDLYSKQFLPFFYYPITNLKKSIHGSYIRRFGLKPGDKIAVSQNDAGRADYRAVYLGIDQYKRHYIGEIGDDDKVVLTEVKDFFSRHNKITDIDKHDKDWASRQQVVNETLSKVGQFYKLLDLDTAHFKKEYVQDKTKRISMAVGAGLGALAAAAALVVLKLRKEKKSLFHAG